MNQFRLRAPRSASTLFASTALVLSACGGDDAPAGNVGAPPEPSELAKSIESAMDTSADPCQDFYRYACGAWLDATTLAADQTSKTRSFTMAEDANELRLDKLMQVAIDEPGTDPDKLRVGAVFGACIDEAAIDAAGTAPLDPYFADIDVSTDAASLMGLIARLHKTGIGAFFGLTTFVLPDGLTAIIVDQAPLSLGEKDAYLRSDAQSVAIRDAFVAHVAKMLELAGDDATAAQAGAQKILALETELANVSLSPAEHRNLVALYHPMDFATLKQTNPGIPWDPYFEALGVPSPTGTINVAVLEYFAAFETLLPTIPKEDLRAYLRWTVMNTGTEQLPKAFRDADFDFYGRTLNGQAEPQSRRAIGVVMGHELTHGFDDQGRIFGADGVPGQYWSDAAVTAFGERTACVKDQFDGYEVQPGLHVDGALTLGENIADLGGIKLSYRTFARLKKASKKSGSPLIEGMTDEQLFFVVYGQLWCQAITPEAERQRVLTIYTHPGNSV